MRMGTLIVAASLLAPLSALAQIGPSGPAEETVELPDLEVIGTKQELALRFIKAGLEADRSVRHEDRNKPYCWFDKATGSHMTYLYCGLNRSLNAESRYWKAQFTPPFGYMPSGVLRDRRHIYRSRSPVSPGEIESMMVRLGPSALNDEIVSRALRGEAPPDKIPSEQEVNRFARALAEIRRLRDDSESDENRMIAAIRNVGLSVERYNEISDLVERYENLRDMVKERL